VQRHNVRGLSASSNPHVCVAGFEIFRSAGHKKLAGNLSPIALRIVTLPGKVWSGSVNIKRILKIVATQMDWHALRRCGEEDTRYQTAQTNQLLHSAAPSQAP
jgi:hypothetical protein